MNRIKLLKHKIVICFSLATFLFSGAMSISSCNTEYGAIPGKPSEFINGKSIPFLGNVYVTSGIPTNFQDGTNVSWSKSDMVVSIYFRVDRAGELKLGVKAVPNGDSHMKVSYLNQTFDLNLSEDGRRIFDIGTINIPKESYVKVDFQGVSKSADTYGRLISLVVDGEAAYGDIVYVTEQTDQYWARRGPSLHMGYEIPKGVNAEWFYNEVYVPEGFDPNGSYFMVNGFNAGYCGLQSTTGRHSILFSIWSTYNTDNPGDVPAEHTVIPLRKGMDITVGEFGGEGSGGQSSATYNWKTNTRIKFLTHIKPSDVVPNSTEYTLYFKGPEEEWQLMASFRRPFTTSYNAGIHSFLECFNPDDSYKPRKVRFHNQWVRSEKGVWYPLNSGTFGGAWTDAKPYTPRWDATGGTEENGFYLAHCGFTDEQFTVSGTKFTVEKPQVEPDFPFDNLPKGMRYIVETNTWVIEE